MGEGQDSVQSLFPQGRQISFTRVLNRSLFPSSSPPPLPPPHPFPPRSLCPHLSASCSPSGPAPPLSFPAPPPLPNRASLRFLLLPVSAPPPRPAPTLLPFPGLPPGYAVSSPPYVPDQPCGPPRAPSVVGVVTFTARRKENLRALLELWRRLISEVTGGVTLCFLIGWGLVWGFIARGVKIQVLLWWLPSVYEWFLWTTQGSNLAKTRFPWLLRGLLLSFKTKGLEEALGFEPSDLQYCCTHTHLHKTGAVLSGRRDDFWAEREVGWRDLVHLLGLRPSRLWAWIHKIFFC